MESAEVIQERLKHLRENVNFLKQERDAVSSLQEFVGNIRLRKAVERALQVAIEACLDIAHHIISEEGFRYPKSSADAFEILGEEDVIPQELLPKLVNMAKFRNILVHEYVHLDNSVVYGVLKKHLGDFEEFAKAIISYLERSEGDDER